MEFEDWIVLRAPPGAKMVDSDMMDSRDAGLPSVELHSIPVSAVADLERDPTTLAAAPDMPTLLIEPRVSGSTPAPLWGITAVGADASAHDGTGVIVAVLDTGIDIAHPSFAGVDIVQADFTRTGLGDGHGHGTHCAGTVFGRDAGGGRIGVAPGIKRALIGKVLDQAGQGSTLMAVRGLEWAADKGAHIASLSLGLDVPGVVQQLIAKGWSEKLAAARGLDLFRRNVRLLDKQMTFLLERPEHGLGMLVIAASGNESDRASNPNFRIPASLPAAAEGVIAVGALEQSPAGLTVAGFSNTLPTVCGPGVAIRSAWPGSGYRELDGTSMACPHVAGIAALWWQALGPHANARAVHAKVIGTACMTDLAPGYDHTDVGMGMVRAP
ncbi:subtilisin family serine protease [Sphingobium sp. B1D7B]|uniref:S8 family peptidase n=1 Tax=unclassified Sphingobium TaxID=2611147 RepID=UPI0029CAAEC3|nr:MULTISPECIES: S8 family serine peptidase [unclassified Sphingobium]MCW2392437.1 subtilisin family serine protease [Sphingobium sp. B11D3A]MCW2404132.1 subtilisin family serine protease [Sphingobium sp. B1D7B]